MNLYLAKKMFPIHTKVIAPKRVAYPDRIWNVKDIIMFRGRILVEVNFLDEEGLWTTMREPEELIKV